MQKLKVGIIGAGMAFERLHYPALSDLTDSYEITAICDVDQRMAPISRFSGRGNYGYSSS
jgi:predicted dehydrogenase